MEQEMEASHSETEGQSLEDKRRSHKASASKMTILLFDSCLLLLFMSLPIQVAFFN